MRSVMVTAVVAVFMLSSAGGMLAAQLPPPGKSLGPVPVIVNSQKSLVEAVGDGFEGEAWVYPTRLLPEEFPELAYVSGPADARGKAAWRKPVVLTNKDAGVEVAVNCYRTRDKQEKNGGPASPTLPLLEPDYHYTGAAFHKLRAASASDGERDVFVFRDGDLLFKVEAVGGKPEARRKATLTVAEAIWKFRQPM